MASVLSSATRFGVAVAGFEDGASHLIDAKSVLGLLRVLHAAIALPVYYNKTIRLGALRAFDAGLSNPLPIRDAIRAGCSHILVLTSRPHDHVARLAPRWQRLIFDARFARGSKPLNEMFASAWRVSNELRREANGEGPGSQLDAAPAIATISPVSSAVSEMTHDKSLLRATLLACAADTARVFGNAGDALAKLAEWEASGVI